MRHGETSIKVKLWDRDYQSEGYDRVHNINLGSPDKMNSEMTFDEPASPLCRPIKFRANQAEDTKKNSQENGANASLSKDKKSLKRITSLQDRTSGRKQSVLSFLRNHDKGKHHMIHTAC